MNKKLLFSLLVLSSFSLYPMETATSKIDLESRRERYKKIRTNLRKFKLSDIDFYNRYHTGREMTFEDALLCKNSSHIQKLFTHGIISEIDLNRPIALPIIRDPDMPDVYYNIFPLAFAVDGVKEEKDKELFRLLAELGADIDQVVDEESSDFYEKYYCHTLVGSARKLWNELYGESKQKAPEEVE